MKCDYSILSLCANLEVSPSGYYDWPPRRTAPGPRALRNQTLAQQIEVIHAQSRAMSCNKSKTCSDSQEYGRW